MGSDHEALCFFIEVWLFSLSPSLVDSVCCHVIVGEREVRNFVVSSAQNLKFLFSHSITGTSPTCTTRVLKRTNFENHKTEVNS